MKQRHLKREQSKMEGGSGQTRQQDEMVGLPLPGVGGRPCRGPSWLRQGPCPTLVVFQAVCPSLGLSFFICRTEGLD